MFCDICNCEVINFYLHKKSNKHRLATNQEIIENPRNIEYCRLNQKKYNESRNTNGKELINCETCNKMIKYYNMSHHRKTQKHINKLNDNNQDFDYKEVDLIELNN